MLRVISGNPSVNFIWQSRKGNRAIKLREEKKRHILISIAV